MALEIIIAADIEPQYEVDDAVKSISLSTLCVPPAPPLPKNGVFKTPYSDRGPRKAAEGDDDNHSDNDSGHGGSVVMVIDLPGLDLSDDEFSEEFASSVASSRRGSNSIATPPTPPPPPALPSYINNNILILPPRRQTLRRIPSDIYSDFDDDDSYLSDYLDPDYLPRVNLPQEEATCIVCYDTVYGQTKRSCCSETVCAPCIRAIIQTNINEGLIFISCPNPECEKGVINREEIIGHANRELKEKYERLRLQVEGDGTKKPCPNCSHITEHSLPKKFRKTRPEDVRLTCKMCGHEWCFGCHAPWHEGISCRQYRRGNKQFKKWTQGQTRGIANCQKCPFCRVYIQRSTGCDHMTCNRCDTHFCYKCGGRFLEFPGLGDHYNRTSVLGCKYNYNADKPAKRLAIRGGYFGAKLAMLTGYPFLFVAGVAVVVVVGAVALPVYGGYRLYKYKKNTRRIRRRRRH